MMADVLDDPARMAVLIDGLQRLLNESAGSTGAASAQAATVAVLSVQQGGRNWSVGLARHGLVSLRPSPDARGLVYSLTKSLIAAAVLRLAARGLVDLDGPAARWLPELADPKRADRAEDVTVANLLEHRAGLPDYGGRADYHQAVAAGEAPWSEAEFLARCGLSGPPVGSFAYSNIGYLLVSRLLVRASGLPFALALREEVFAPLGLTSASVPVERGDLAGLLFGTSPLFGGAAVADRYHPGWVAHGVAAMTARDAARFVHGLSDSAYLPAALAQRMCHGAPVNAPMGGRPWVEPGYGLGLMVERDAGRGAASGGASSGAWGHTGGGPGLTVAAYHCPGGGACESGPLSVAVFTDCEDPALAEWMVVEAAQSLA